MRRRNSTHITHDRSLRVGCAGLAILAAAAILLSGGCESVPTTRPRAETSIEVKHPDSPAVSESATEEASELATLAARDVEAFLNRQGRSDESREAQPESARRESREILWNTPDDDEKSEADREVEQTPVQPSELFLLSDDEEPNETKSPAANDAPDGDATLDQDRIRELIVELSKELYREATYADMPLRELMLIAATTMVTPDRALDPQAIPALTPRERELLGEFQSFFAHVGQQLDGSRTADEVLMHALDELRSSLRTEPQLQLDAMALCTRVGGFGDYDPFNRYAFLAHSEQQAVLYLELAGFTSELNQKNEWVTELSLQVMIYSDRDGIPVWREDWQTAVDVSRKKRQDFFMVQIMTLPKALSVGKYHLKIRVRDEKSGAEAEGSITFEMVADPKLAAGAGR